MADFPRTKKPRRFTFPDVPAALISRGLTGSVQTRATGAIGRIWRETWGPLNAGDEDVQALLAFIQSSYHQGTIFDALNYLLPGSGMAANGTGGGTPLVDGASQSGSSLATKGWTADVTDVVKSGDVFRVAGLSQLFTITADGDSDGSGDCTLTINPPIASGDSPANEAALTISGAKVRAIVLAHSPFPEAAFDEYIAGLTVSFAEAV